MPPAHHLKDWLGADAGSRRAGVELCLERIRVMDPALQAWVVVRPQKPTGTGPLSGIPFGVKDIIDTDALPTEYGSPVYRGRRAGADAPIVRQIRSRGAILLGKTQTAAFAHTHPAPTRNPRDPRHTPGGSSSGSAAAVAAGMVPFALGTQTLGSVLRPASYCGVTGFKPSHGLISLDGVLLMAKSLDTLGFFTYSPADMLTLWECLGQPETAPPPPFPLGFVEELSGVEPVMASAFDRTVSALRSAGVPLRSVPFADTLLKLAAGTTLIRDYEGARVHEQRFKEFGDRLDDLAVLVRNGLSISDGDYQDAQRFVANSKQQLKTTYATTPVILTPAATGPAPFGLSSTGDPRMNAPWTALGTPAISIPMPVEGLPLGLQLTADHGQDSRVLQTAVRVAECLRARR